MKQSFAQNGVPKKLRTDPETVLVSEAFAEFCKQIGLEHITCPVRDHTENGKIKRANKQRIPKKLIRSVGNSVRIKGK